MPTKKSPEDECSSSENLMQFIRILFWATSILKVQLKKRATRTHNHKMPNQICSHKLNCVFPTTELKPLDLTASDNKEQPLIPVCLQWRGINCHKLFPLFFPTISVQSLFFSSLKNSYSSLVQKQILEQQTKGQRPKTWLKRLLSLGAELDLLL